MKDRICSVHVPQVIHLDDNLHHRTVPAGQRQLRMPSQILKDRSAFGPKSPSSEQHQERPGAPKASGNPSFERSLEIERDKYKTLYGSLLTVYEQSRRDARAGEDLESEVKALRLQLLELHGAKDALEGHLATLLRRPPTSRTMGGPDSKVAGCVVCLDNAANLVCLPCKHLALCSGCSGRTNVDACPICRCKIDDRMEIFLP